LIILLFCLKPISNAKNAVSWENVYPNMI